MEQSKIEKQKAETKAARSKIADVIASSQTIAKPHVVSSLNVPTENRPKNILLYLYHYLGVKCQDEITGEYFGLTYNMLFEIFYQRVKAKPVLRKLSTISNSEIIEVQPHLFIKTRAICPTIDNCRMFVQQAETTRLLIKKGFDVFGLIDAGLAIEDISTKETPLSS